MKIIYLLYFVFFLNSNVFCQISIEDLDNPIFSVRLSALERIVKEKLVDFIPEIQSRLFDQTTLTMQFSFLEALAKLDDPEIESWTLQFIENADNFQYPDDDPLYYKVLATGLLFDIGNYSTVQYLFDLLNRDRDIVNPSSLALLKITIMNIPERSEEATEELVRIFNNAKIDGIFRNVALDILYDTDYTDIMNLALTAAINDQSPVIRDNAIRILKTNNYSGLHNLYVQQLSIDSDPTIRSRYATSLLNLYGEPSDLKIVIDYLPNETDTTILSWVDLAVDNFIPPKPDELNWQGMITELVSYTSEMFTYGWITHAKTRDYYISTLNLLNSQLERQLYTEACATLNIKLLDRIETDLAANKITTEGYKFLHYYCVYIKEEFPGPLPCL
jgi:hypothetical protein